MTYYMELKIFVTFGALFGAIGVIMGAFGAHYFKDILSANQLNTLEIGVRYQLLHAVALIALAACSTYFTSIFIPLSLWTLIAGTLLFSGSLYLYTFTLLKAFAIITPIGGLLLVLGWLFYAIGALRS